MNTFELIISSPDGKCFEGQIQSILMRGADGDFAVMAKHIPFITAIVPFACTLTLADGTQKHGKTDGGILSIEDYRAVFASRGFCFNE